MPEDEARPSAGRAVLRQVSERHEGDPVLLGQESQGTEGRQDGGEDGEGLRGDAQESGEGEIFRAGFCWLNSRRISGFGVDGKCSFRSCLDFNIEF